VLNSMHQSKQCLPGEPGVPLGPWIIPPGRPGIPLGPSGP
jgi:hypothetical protein